MMSNIEYELAKISQAKLESDHCEESSQAEAYFCKKKDSVAMLKLLGL